MKGSRIVRFLDWSDAKLENLERTLDDVLSKLRAIREKCGRISGKLGFVLVLLLIIVLLLIRGTVREFIVGMILDGILRGWWW